MAKAKQNPYAGVKFTLASGAEITDLRLGKSKEAAVASNGEINAHSNKELLGKITEMLTASSKGEIVRQAPEKDRRLHREVLAAAFNDKGGQKWGQLGVALAAKIEESAYREGFMRNLLVEEQLNQGEVPRARMRVNNVIAMVATSISDVIPQLVRERIFYPPEFYINANVEVENRDIDQISSDILDEKYTEGLQNIMVQEDLLWKKLADGTVGSANNITYIAGVLTPTTLSTLRNNVSHWKIPATTCLLAQDFWNDIVGNSEFQGMLDPVSKYDLVLNGELGILLGLRIVTDGYRAPELQVLQPGEIYVVGAAQNHGQFTTRGGVESTPIDGALQGRNSKGWFLAENLSVLISNARSVAKGVKIG
jgi:hypothetical protein